MTKTEVKPAEGYGFPAELLTPISPITQLYVLSQTPVTVANPMVTKLPLAPAKKAKYYKNEFSPILGNRYPLYFHHRFLRDYQG